MVRRPVDAFKITSCRTFTPAEIVDVNAAACLLRDDMPAIAGPRKTVWPSLCASTGVRSEQLVMGRAEILYAERTRWKQHEEYYVQPILGIIVLAIAMGTRDVGERNISEALHASSFVWIQLWIWPIF